MSEATFEFWSIKPSDLTDKCQHKWFEHPMLEHWRTLHSPLHPDDHAAICHECGDERTVGQMDIGEVIYRKVKP